MLLSAECEHPPICNDALVKVLVLGTFISSGTLVIDASLSSKFVPDALNVWLEFVFRYSPAHLHLVSWPTAFAASDRLKWTTRIGIPTRVF